MSDHYSLPLSYHNSQMDVQYYPQVPGEENMEEMLETLGETISPAEVDPHIIHKVAQTLDFKNIDANPVNDAFQKAQYELIVDDPQFYQPQIDVPTEGELLPLEYQHPNEMGSFQGNNGNNITNAYYQPSNDNWKQMEPINYHMPVIEQEQVFHHNTQNFDWKPMEPIQPVFQYEPPVIAAEKSQDEILADIQREKNKGYSAVCLKKKKERREKGKLESDELTKEIRQLEQQNQEKEALLCFTVNDVMAPFSGGNNQIFDLEEVKECVEFYEKSKENIGMGMENNRNNDEGVKNAWENLQTAEFKAAEAAEHLKNKKEAAKALKVSENTIGSRNTRAKQDKEMFEYEYSIAVNTFELQKQQSLSSLLDETWKYFKFPVSQIIENYPRDLYEHVKLNGQEMQLSKLRHFLFQDAG